ncbi:MAG: hypothetical protein ACR2NP_22760, partial [Pirellulaceae bacterium]
STISITNTNFPDPNNFANRLTVSQPREIYTMYATDHLWQYPVHRGKTAGQLYYGAPQWR